MWWWFLRNVLPGPLVRLVFGPRVEGALATGAPVVPVAMLNTDRVWRAGHRLPALRRVRIRIGAPVRIGDDPDVRVVTDAIMRELARLSGRPQA